MTSTSACDTASSSELVARGGAPRSGSDKRHNGPLRRHADTDLVKQSFGRNRGAPVS
jgi:hypothetical protein